MVSQLVRPRHGSGDKRTAQYVSNDSFNSRRTARQPRQHYRSDLHPPPAQAQQGVLISVDTHESDDLQFVAATQTRLLPQASANRQHRFAHG